MRVMLHVAFKETPLNGRRDIAVKVFSSTSKVPFIIGRLQFNTCSLHAMHIECFVWSFRKISRIEADMISQNNVLFTIGRWQTN